DEQALAVVDLAGRGEMRHAADALDRQVLIDRREIVDVGAGLHGDDVAVLRGRDGVGDVGVLLAGANGKSGHGSGISFAETAQTLTTRNTFPVPGSYYRRLLSF